MRVTDNMTFDLMRQNLLRTRAHANEMQEAAQRGRRVLAPSDDPVATATAFGERAKEQRVEGQLRTINVGLGALELLDSSFEQMNDVMTKARELAIQAANDTSDAEAREQIAQEVRAMRDQLINLANVRQGDRFLLAGMQEDQPAFDATGSFQGDDNVRTLEVADGLRIEDSVSASSVFNAPGGVDIFAELEALSVALDANDAAGIQAGVGAMRSGQRQISDGHSRIGSRMESFLVAESSAIRVRDAAVAAQTELLGKETEAAYVDFARAQNAYQEALSIAGQLPLPNLLQQR